MGNKSITPAILTTTTTSKTNTLPPTTEVQCCISVDIDAVAGWLGSYGGEDSTSDISRGMFAGTIGVRRLLNMFDKYNIKTTWFIPGHSLETFPEECRMIADKGHEIGLHGYSHENPIAMTLEQQTAIMDKVGYCFGAAVGLWFLLDGGFDGESEFADDVGSLVL